MGDTHGNSRWLHLYVYPTAVAAGADAIIQLGDFGYWEHSPDGVAFLDLCAELVDDTGIPLWWLHGNHDKHRLALARYGDAVTGEGFLECRPGVCYIPNGRLWFQGGVGMRAFGGAYSVDKDDRLLIEAKRAEKIRRKNGYRAAAGQPLADPDTAGTLWFPEEEMSDADMTALLAEYSGPVDVVFSHDKPRAANPDWNRKDFPECLPNQDRLQRALVAHKPKLWFHGHLHYAYESMVRSGDDDTFTRVIGVSCDIEAAPPGWRRTDAWWLLDIDDGDINVISGTEWAAYEKGTRRRG